MSGNNKTICNSCGSVTSGHVTGQNVSVAIDIRITPILFVEGLLIDIRHHIQGMRKKCGYNIDDRIVLCSSAARMLNFDYIRKDVLADAIFSTDNNIGCDLVEEVHGIIIGIKKIKNENTRL